MWKTMLRWFREECPHCREKLIHLRDSLHSHAKHCPNGHFILETHPTLGVQVELHPKNGR